MGTGSERSNNPPGCPNAEPCETSERTLFWSTDPFADHYHQDATSSSSVVGTDQLLLLFAAFRSPYAHDYGTRENGGLLSWPVGSVLMTNSDPLAIGMGMDEAATEANNRSRSTRVFASPAERYAGAAAFLRQKTKQTPSGEQGYRISATIFGSLARCALQGS